MKNKTFDIDIAQWRTALLIPRAAINNSEIYTESRDLGSKLGIALKTLLAAKQRDIIELSEGVPLTWKDHKIHDWLSKHPHEEPIYWLNKNSDALDDDDVLYMSDEELTELTPVYGDMSVAAVRRREKRATYIKKHGLPQYRAIATKITRWHICPHINIPDNNEKHFEFLCDEPVGGGENKDAV